jgi:Flp pilus assembly protein TadD
VRAFEGLARVHLAREETAAALRCLRQAVALEPANPEAHQKIGDIAAERGATERAVMPTSGRSTSRQSGPTCTWRWAMR